MKTLGGLLLPAVTYLLSSLMLVLIVTLALPGEVDPQGHVTGRASLLLDLCANGVACFLAGAVAPGHAPAHARAPGLGACAVVLAVAAVSTLAFWNATPAWYNWALLGTTAPFVAIGVSWRRALQRTAAPAEAT